MAPCEFHASGATFDTRFDANEHDPPPKPETSAIEDAMRRDGRKGSTRRSGEFGNIRKQQ